MKNFEEWIALKINLGTDFYMYFYNIDDVESRGQKTTSEFV